MRITTGRALAAVPVACACLLTTAFAVTGVRTNLATTTVKVTSTGPVRTVTPVLLGLNGVNTAGPQWDNSPFDSVLKKFAPGVIRYPGGTVANYWSWPDGWFQPGKWPGEPAKAVNDTLPVFGAALAAAGAAPLFDLNTVTINGAIGSAAENAALLGQQLQALQSAAGDGLPVTMVELGNELYQSGYISTGPDGQDYCRAVPERRRLCDADERLDFRLAQRVPGRESGGGGNRRERRQRHLAAAKYLECQRAAAAQR